MTVYAGTRPIQLNFLTSGLLTYLDFASSFSYRSGNVWKDISGNNNNATINANAVYTASYGGGFKRGATGNIASGPTLTVSAGYSIDMWIRTVTSAAENNIITMGTHEVFHTSAGRLFMSVGAGNYADTTSYGSLDNTLFHLVATMTSDKFFSMYVNGSLVSSNGPYSGVTSPGTVTLSIGDAYQNLEMYQVRIYNSALNSTQVSRNFNATRTRFGV